MKRFSKLCLSILLVLTLLVGLAPAMVSAEDAVEPEVKTVYILHTNDVHARVIGDTVPGDDALPVDEGLIGFARYKAVIDKFKEVYPDQVLVVDAGDMIHGTNFATLSKGQSVVRLLNDMGLNAMTLGNHEFNYGKDELKSAISEADFSVLSANVLDEADGSNVFDSNTIIEVNGLKIGLFGISTPETKVKASPVNTEGWNFEDPTTVAQEQVDALKAEGVDAIVMLSHLGMDAESVETSYKLLDSVEGIDLIVDGHSHTYLPEGEVYNDTLIASTGSYLNNIGLVTLTFTDGALTDANARLISFQEATQYGEDQATLDSVAAIEAENERITGVEIGTLAADLDGEREQVRAGETNLSHLIADAMLEKTGADAVITNGGGIRASIPAGTVTYGDFLTVLPFGNMVTVIKVTGQDIVDALSYGTDAYPETAGKFPQVAGISFDLVQDGEAYKVENVMIQGEPVDPAAEYSLATNDFMAIGGDGYTMFEGKEQVLLEGLMIDVVVDHVKSLMDEDGNFSFELEPVRMNVVSE
ncbi:MAG: bifunctional UDP-sugar hydrolase/5'-nucleotidase [Eubacteriales bacterium]|nr:bifunctional UDP-sugar hydrolase/5'-nucleotidase [Eubacteriales bacterium]